MGVVVDVDGRLTETADGVADLGPVGLLEASVANPGGFDTRLGAQEALREDRTAATDPARLSGIWDDVLGMDREWLTLDLEFRLYAMRNEDARKTWVAHERQLRDLVARFIEEQQKALGASSTIDADTMAGIVMPASQGFWQWAALDPDQSHYYTAFLEVFIKGVGYKQR